LKRRTFLLRALGATAAAAAGLAGYAYAFETRNVQFDQRIIRIPGLPKHLKGYTIGVLADLHVGPTTHDYFVREVVEKLAAMKPDLVVVVGDFIGSHDHLPAADRVLEPVKGCLGVLGNWDYYDRFIRTFMSNVNLLINQGVLVADGLWVGGVDEPRLGDPDVGKAMQGAPEGAVRILLCHEPDFADTIVRP
jgi:predicted MPP superfamily phosphohydrolase